MSPYSGIGATLALSFVLTVSGVKAIAEDFKRHQEDHNTNNSKSIRITKEGTYGGLLLAGVVAAAADAQTVGEKQLGQLNLALC